MLLEALHHVKEHGGDENLMLGKLYGQEKNLTTPPPPTNNAEPPLIFNRPKYFSAMKTKMAVLIAPVTHSFGS
jgi:hypothetical protein